MSDMESKAQDQIEGGLYERDQMLLEIKIQKIALKKCELLLEKLQKNAVNKQNFKMASQFRDFKQYLGSVQNRTSRKPKKQTTETLEVLEFV